ncbi:MAG: SDR family oxidoreductase [Steroidobacteraceae bacterium]
MNAADARPLNLVFGASGYIGTNLVPALLAAGKRVRATARNREVLEAREWRDVECVQADALAPASLDRALQGVDVAFYLVHSMAAGRGFGQLDAQAAANFGAAAARAGVRRIVYLGGLIPPNPRSEHLRSRAETGEVLRASGVPVTELRAGMIIGPGSAAYEVIRDLVNHLPVMTTPLWVRSKTTPIALDDLLACLIAVAEIAQAAGRIFDAAGPEVVTYEQIMRCYGRQVGRHPWIVPVPVLTPRLSSYWLRLVTTVPVGIARALVEGLEHDFVARDAELLRLVPRKRLGLEDAILAARDADQRHTVVARWVEGSIACRNFRPEYAYYAERAGASATAAVEPARVFATVCAIGGDGGWFFAKFLWWLRRALDWAVGGPSLRRARRHPTRLRVGDVVDGWRVIALEPDRRLTLMMEMKAPGAGVLEFNVEPLPDGRCGLSATAYWHPAGVPGLLYWYALAPAHAFIFKGLTRAILRRAAQAPPATATAA